MNENKDIFKLRVEGDPVLRQICEVVPQDYPNLKEVIQKMYNTLENTPNGVGLAAPQIGLPLRIFILGGKNMSKITFINPEVILKGKLKKGTEGCLSIPGVWGDVERHNIVKVKFYDENFKKHNLKFRDFEAIVIQHENDHLNGIEFYDHLDDKEKNKIEDKLVNLRRGEFPDTGLEYFKHKNHEEIK